MKKKIKKTKRELFEELESDLDLLAHLQYSSIPTIVDDIEDNYKRFTQNEKNTLEEAKQF